MRIAGPSKSWSIFAGGATALVDYVDGLEQSGNWNSGVTGGLSFKTKNRRLQAVTAFGYASTPSAVTDEAGIVRSSCCNTTSVS